MLNLSEMVFSAMQRYVRIVETVRFSNALLSPQDRLELIDEILKSEGNPSKAEIEKLCADRQDEKLGDNMTKAQILRTNGY